MKNKLTKILNNKNIKIIIPGIVLIVLLIIVCIYLKEYQYNRYRNKKDYSFYQYFAGQKIEYEATVSFNKKEEIKAFVPKGIKIDYDSIPIYYKEEKKVIFPSEMNIIFPLKNDLQRKIKEFTYVEKINNIYYLTFEDYKNNLDHYVMYDGSNLYFFSDSMSFNIDNEKITLSPMSYVIAKRNEFTYYDYEKDEYNKIEVTDDIVLTNEYYTINVTNDYIDYDNNRFPLTGELSLLSVLEKEKK